MACWGLEAAASHMECSARIHSFRLSTSYPVRFTSSLGQTWAEGPRECRERARQAAATRLGGNWRKVLPWTRECSHRNYEGDIRTIVARAILF